jgi:F-type H+-transporting ATPase subunit b
MYRAWLVAALGLAASMSIWCAPAAVRAEDKHKVAAVKADPEEGEAGISEELSHEAKEVNRDLFRPAMDLGIWTLIVFLLLLIILGKFAWKPMIQGLEHRERAIHSALHEAQQAREEAANLRAQLEEQLRHANEQSRQILDEARRAAERTTAEMVAEAHKKIQAEHDRLQREMNLSYAQARRDLQTEAAQLATLVASKVIRRQMNHDDHRQLVEEALAELRLTGDGRQQAALV